MGRRFEAGSYAALARLRGAARRRRRAAHLRRPADVRGKQRRLDRRRPLHCLHVVGGRLERHRHAGRHRYDDGAVGAGAAGPRSRSDESGHRQRGTGAGSRSGGASELIPWRRRRRRAGRSARRPHRLERSGAARHAVARSGHDNREPHAGSGRPFCRADGLDRSGRRAWRRGSSGSLSRHVHRECRDRSADARSAGSGAVARADRTRRWAGWSGRRVRRPVEPGVRARRTDAVLPFRGAHVCGANQSKRRGGRGWNGGGRRRTWSGPGRRTGRRQRRDYGHRRFFKYDRPSGDVHRQPRGRSQGAPRAGVQRGMADHEEPLLRRQHARRRLECGQTDVRAASRLPCRRR